MTDDLDAALVAHPADQEAAVTVTPSKPRPHRHVWAETSFGAPWPAWCRWCGLETLDPDGYFWPVGADEDVLPESYHCDASPALLHELGPVRCSICGTPKDPVRSRRAKNNRKRGLAKQRQANRILGITNIAGNAPNHDGGKHDEMFASESKSGAAFSERYWRWLTDIPTLAGQIPVLVVADAPGPGRITRRMVIVRAEDWRDLHGGTPSDA